MVEYIVIKLQRESWWSTIQDKRGTKRYHCPKPVSLSFDMEGGEKIYCQNGTILNNNEDVILTFPHRKREYPEQDYARSNHEPPGV